MKTPEDDPLGENAGNVNPRDAELADSLRKLGEQLRANEQARQKLEESERALRAFDDITLAALRTETTEELLQLLADRLGEIINAKGSFLTLWDDKEQRVIPAAAYGELRDRYKSTLPRPGEPTMTEHVLSTGKPLAVSDVFESPYLSRRLAEEFPSRSMLALPLIARGNKIGAALIAFDYVREFTDEEIDLCWQIARQLALAIQNALSLDALKDSEERYRQIFEANLAIKMIVDADTGAIIRANQAACSFYGYSLEEITALKITDININQPEDVHRDLARAAAGEEKRFELSHRLKNGDVRNVEVFAGPLQVDGKRVVYSIIQDVTERVRLEEQLMNTHKMEAIGRMAGGIAHDFNNLLTLIVGSFDVLQETVPDDESRAVLARGVEAAERAANLTHQLLVASRKQVSALEKVDLNGEIKGLWLMLESMVGNINRLELDLEADQGTVEVDRSQFEQIVTNLVVNARDAMPDGGTCTIRTWNTGTGSPRLFVLSVRDSGVGLDDVTRARMFEPFFTTKGEEGTGLGLATVYGIVRDYGGTIDVRSDVGKGTELRIFLPVVDSRSAIEVSETGEDSPVTELARGQTILIAEDNEGILELTRRTLSLSGYHVICAADGVAALEAMEQADRPVDLLLTDVLMPGLSGRELAKKVRAAYPAVPIVYMSGYTDDAIDGGLEDNAIMVPKPFRPSALVRQIHGMLAQGTSNPG